MRITTKAVYDIATGDLLEWEGYEYDGPVALAGGGPSASQRNAADSQSRLADEQAAIARENQKQQQAQFAKIDPFATERLKNGLPFFNALTDFNSAENAQGYAPMRADILRSTNSMGDLPSGYRDAQLNRLEAMRARDFDSGLKNALFANEQSKQDAARMLTGQAQLLNPLGYFSGASQGYNSIMQAPLAKPGIGGLLGGLAGGAMQAAMA